MESAVHVSYLNTSTGAGILPQHIQKLIKHTLGHDNKYPGACCDVWSQLYSYSFAQNSDWTREYPGQEEILSYLMGVAQQYNLYQHIRFNSTVENATWDDSTKKWKIHVSTAKGSKDAEFNPEYDINADFLVSAVGQLNVPKWPDIPGLKDFEGKFIHSARWDWSYDLKDKKIAVIGNGESCYKTSDGTQV